MERPVVALVKGPVGPSAEQITRMVDQAVDHLGGMERFVKPGDYVTIKGNFFAPYPPPVIVAGWSPPLSGRCAGPGPAGWCCARR